MSQHGFGLPPPPNAKPPIWGARAIYYRGLVKISLDRRKQVERQYTCTIDILWDRQQFTGEEEACKPLEDWLNNRGLDALRALCLQEDLQGDENRLIEVNEDGFHLQANPNRSHGYLYMVAWKD